MINVFAILNSYLRSVGTFRWKGGGGYVIRFDDIPDMAARFLYALMKWCPQRIFGVSCSVSGKKSQE
jgi:hypothetical protein